MQNSNISSKARQIIPNFSPPVLSQFAPEKPTHSPLAPEDLSDKELYQKCQLYGGEARKWAKRFAALLPEVARRELFRKYKFYSIYEFAAKLAGMKHETVIDILRVTKKLEGMPLLRAQMETAGWGKLKVVAGIATKENEKCLRRKLQQCLWRLYLHLYKKLENKIAMMSKAESIRAKMKFCAQFNLNKPIF